MFQHDRLALRSDRGYIKAVCTYVCVYIHTYMYVKIDVLKPGLCLKAPVSGYSLYTKNMFNTTTWGWEIYSQRESL